MRNKIYYLNDEINNGLFTTGSEWMLEDLTEYKGSYHSYITGEVYTEASWNPITSKPLLKFKLNETNTVEYNTLKPNIKTSYDSVTQSQPTINNEDIKKQSITRYFLQNVSSRIIYEVDKEQYESHSTKKIDANLYTAVKLTWFIAGLKNSNHHRNQLTSIKQKAVYEKNAEQIEIAAAEMPNIRNYLTNLEEFYFDTSYISPPDINGLE